MTRRSLFGTLLAPLLARWMPKPNPPSLTEDRLRDLGNAISPDWPYPGAKGGEIYFYDTAGNLTAIGGYSTAKIRLDPNIVGPEPNQ